MMPNIRQMKKREAKTCKWTKEAMEEAVQEVQAGRLSARMAAVLFNVPKSSLSDRVSGRVAPDSVHGQKQLLTLEDENSLVEYCLYSASHGSPLTKSHVVAHALSIYNYRNPDKPKTVLGQTWWINFRERHQHRLAYQTPDITRLGKKSCRSLLSPTPAPLTPLSPDAAHPSSNPHLTHPLVASGVITADLVHVLSKTNKICNIVKVRRNARVLTAQVMSEVIKKVEDNAAGMEAQRLARGDRVQQQGAEDTSPAVTSSTLPGGSRPSWKKRRSSGSPSATNSGPSAAFALTSASHSPSMLPPGSTPSHLSLPSKDQHHQIAEAPSLWQTSFTPPAALSSCSSSSTAGPTTSTAAKRQKQEKRILKCGRCRQPYPPHDPEGLVLWVQCDNCHKLFHTICVSSEMDLNDDEFWCFWCLDV